jgi:pimeloyl-ACP methyl ester carboxylesterase
MGLPATITAVVIILMWSQGCAVNKLNQDLQRADDNYAYIKVDGMDTISTDSLLHLILYQRSASGEIPSNYRSPPQGVDAYFLVPEGDYTVVAFEDINRDRKYQRGEPAAFDADPPLYMEITERSTELDYEAIAGVSLELSSNTELAFEIDLSLQANLQSLDQSEQHYLTVTDWDNPAFAEDNVKKGLWQPLSFHEHTGFGLYLLEPLDTTKQPIIFVHGINGSPLNFKALIDALPESLALDYQVMLFQYPSGFALEHSAYMLRQSVKNLLDEFSYGKAHVIAHSMGGLVARQMITQSDAQNAAKLDKFITLSTPWSGHEAARLGVVWSPAVAPVWKSMVPNSRFLQDTFSQPLPAAMQHHLFFSFAQSRNGASKADDGVVTVKSQLNNQAQHQASRLYGIDDNHNGILSNPCVAAIVAALLQETSEPPPACIEPL